MTKRTPISGACKAMPAATDNLAEWTALVSTLNAENRVKLREFIDALAGKEGGK